MSASDDAKMSPPPPLPPQALKRGQTDSISNQINSIGSGGERSVIDDAHHPNGRSKIQKMYSIHPLCSTIGGVYNLQTANVALQCAGANAADDNVLIPAHKSILAADSPVFYREFYVHCREATTFRISNTSPDLLCKFLASFYGKSMQLHRAELPELMQMAYDFDAGKCKETCHAFMHKSLDTGIDDVLWILQFALNYNCKQIRERCIETIHRYGDFLIETDAFLTSTRQVFKLIVGADFAGRNEKKLFAACVEWAKRRIEVQNVPTPNDIHREIGKCFEMIRFDAMSAEQFVECLSEFTMIFGPDEIQAISRTISGRRQPMVEPNGGVVEQRKGIPRGTLFTIRHIFTNQLADYRKLYNDNVSADMHFIFDGSDDRIAAHKCILATRSSIFANRLFESIGPVDVLVRSASPQTFSEFLKLLYGYRIDEIVQKSNMDAILSLADEYSVHDIAKGQEMQLKQFVTLENLFWMANLCRKFPFIDSMNFNCKWIKKNANKFDLNLAFHSKALVQCSRKIVRDALGIDYNHRNALRVFIAAINWAKHRCGISKPDPSVTSENLRRQLDGILTLIPFHQMSRQQFDMCLSYYPGLLNEMEIQDVLAKMTPAN